MTRKGSALPRPRTRQGLSGLLAATIAGALIPFIPLAANAAQAAPDTAPVCQPEIATVDAAIAMAKACKTRVEVLAQRTETMQVFVNPDGTSTYEQYAFPQRARKADGSWAKLDANLQANPDGSISPIASTVEMTFSGGGNGSLISAKRDNSEIKLSWPGKLPKPVIEGAKATYPEVFPGVDLVVTASANSFSEVLVVKTAEAAANPALKRLNFGSSLKNLSWKHDDKQLRAVDGTGKAVLAAAAPLMWDSTPAPAGAEGRKVSDLTGPADGARTAPIAVEAVNDRLSLIPDAGLLTDPAAKFPLFIDPTVGYTSWTMINEYFPDQSYWSFDKYGCADQGWSGECAKVGWHYVGNTVRYRSMFEFSPASYYDKQIYGANFSIDLMHSASCDAYNWTQLRLVSASLNSGTTWNNTAGAWGGDLAAVNNQSCSQQRKLTEFVGQSLTDTIATAARDHWSVTTLGLKAEDETNTNDWKKFDATSARLIVHANTVPNMPDQLTVDGKACVSGANRPWIKTATPSLKAHFWDGDGDSMNIFFAVAKWDGANFVDVAGAGGSKGNIPNNATDGIPTGVALVNGRYTFRAQSNDHPSSGPRGGVYAVSPVTHVPGNCEFEVDTAAPVGAPVVTADRYFDQSAGCPLEGCGSVGKTGSFTFSFGAGNTDVKYYKWGFTDPPTNIVTPGALGGSVNVDWTPAQSGPHTLKVIAYDRADNPSTVTYTSQFIVAAASPVKVQLKLNEPSGDCPAPGTECLLDMTGFGNNGVWNGGTLGSPGRLVQNAGGESTSAIKLDGVDDTVTTVTSGPSVVDTSKSFTVSAWVKADAIDGWHTALSMPGTKHSAFFLRHNEAKWVFSTTADPNQSSYPNDLKSTTPAVAGVWTHVAGVYDMGAKQIKLYVNGVLEGSMAVTGVFQAPGALTIGKSKWNSGEGMYFRGSVADVQLWDRVVSSADVAGLSAAAKTGEWTVGQGAVGDGDVTDTAGFNRTLKLRNGATVPSGNTRLVLDGIDDYGTTEAPVLNTDQSFTVSAKVYMTQAPTGSVYPTILSQAGPTYSAFELEARPGGWCIQRRPSPTTYAFPTGVCSSFAPALNTWTTLIAVYDAQNLKTRLYVGVNGAQPAMVGEASMDRGSMWNATGALHVGTKIFDGVPSEFFKGEIDDIQVHQGVYDAVLLPGQKLFAGQTIASKANNYELKMQTDGNLVLYQNGTTVKWSPNTYGNPGAYAHLQTDGNLVIYSATGAPLWASNTAGQNVRVLAVQNDGNVVLYGPTGQAFWDSF